MTKYFAPLMVLFLLSGCTPMPPPANNTPRSPEATTAWQSHEIQKSLDLIRDIAVDANAMDPPVLTTDATRFVVKFHSIAIQLVHDRPNGWQAGVLQGLNELSQVLDATDFAVIAKYVLLTRGLFNGGGS